MKHGVLLLSHCGFSFMEDLLDTVAERGLEAYVLSSQPLPEHSERLQALAARCAWLGCASGHELQVADIDCALNELNALDNKVQCCMCVWEGYRRLMAHGNKLLGIDDMSFRQVELLSDKLRLRETLAVAGLSNVQACRLSVDILLQLQRSGRRMFIKPIRGIASYGTFPLRADTTWQQLETVKHEARKDTVYRSAFGGDIEFMAEDYIEGSEYSFELLCYHGETYFVAVHEKPTVTELENTMLEDCCTAPPLNLDQHALIAGTNWLRNICSHLDLRWGCYHIEARYDGIRWELIEINSRVGGSLISSSVGALTGGRSMIALWLDMLLSQSGHNRKFVDELATLHLQDVDNLNGKATFFRVYFAKPGTIASVHTATIRYVPEVSQILLRAGDCITESAREVFLGQMMWTFDLKQRAEILPALLSESANALNVQYEAVA